MFLLTTIFLQDVLIRREGLCMRVVGSGVLGARATYVLRKI